MKRKHFIVAIDGPAGAGKSTIARIVARELGYLYIDTGAMYRAITWQGLKLGINFRHGEELERIARTAKISLKQDKKHGTFHVFIDGEDITAKIRTEKVSRHSKLTAGVPGVRKILRAQQQKMGRKGGVVMEGRDIGTAVFPNADVKFFLDATPMERAERRYRELKAKGKRVSLQRIAHALAQRDYQDRHRGASPLKKADDAIEIDSTQLPLEKVVHIILDVVRSRQAADRRR